MTPLFLTKKITPETFSQELVGLKSQISTIRSFCNFAWSPDWEQHSKTLRFMPTILLYGPPGTGKTSILKNLASMFADEGVEYYRESLDLFAHKDLGETSKAVECLFSTIKERASCEKKVLLQLDDVDSLLSSRHLVNESSGVRRAVNTFLIQLDDLMLEEYKFPPIIAATTNMLGYLDVAIKRRFSLQLEINPKLTENQLKELISPIIDLFLSNVDPDYKNLESITKERNLTPNDIIRAMQLLYLKNIVGIPPSDSDISNAFLGANSSATDYNVESLKRDNQRGIL